MVRNIFDLKFCRVFTVYTCLTLCTSLIHCLQNDYIEIRLWHYFLLPAWYNNIIIFLDHTGNKINIIIIIINFSKLLIFWYVKSYKVEKSSSYVQYHGCIHLKRRFSTVNTPMFESHLWPSICLLLMLFLIFLLDKKKRVYINYNIIIRKEEYNNIMRGRDRWPSLVALFQWAILLINTVYMLHAHVRNI